MRHARRRAPWEPTLVYIGRTTACEVVSEFSRGPDRIRTRACYQGWISRYELLVFLHVFGSIVWIGVGMTGHALLVWSDRRDQHEFAATLSMAIKWIELPALVFGPLLLVVTGVALVLDGPWGFGDTWVLVGLGGYAAALVFGGVFQAPGTKRVNALLAERGPDDPEVIALGRRLNALMWPELAILLVVLLAMTTKPTGSGSVGFWSLWSRSLPSRAS